MPVDHSVVNDAFDRIQEAVNEILNAVETLSQDECCVLRTHLYDHADYVRHGDGIEAAGIIDAIIKYAKGGDNP